MGARHHRGLDARTGVVKGSHKEMRTETPENVMVINLATRNT